MWIIRNWIKNENKEVSAKRRRHVPADTFECVTPSLVQYDIVIGMMMVVRYDIGQSAHKTRHTHTWIDKCQLCWGEDDLDTANEWGKPKVIIDMAIFFSTPYTCGNDSYNWFVLDWKNSAESLPTGSSSQTGLPLSLILKFSFGSFGLLKKRLDIYL